MEWLNEITEKHEEWNRLRDQAVIVEEYLDSKPEASIDGSKAIIETVCKTILTDKGIVFEETSSVPQLSKQTFESIVTEHLTQHENIQSLKKINSGFGQVVVGVCELRNRNGLISHGHDVQLARISPMISKLTAGMTDSICGFYIQTHRQFNDVRERHRLLYRDYEEFNKYYDEINGSVKLGDLQYTASETLFNNDPEAYREILLEFLEMKESIEDIDDIRIINPEE